MTKLNSLQNSLRETCPSYSFAKDSTLVLFGEIFQRGYANGLLEAASKKNLNVIYSTVGRREKDQTLRPLNNEELAAAPGKNLINVPLEAGFDLTADQEGLTPVERLKDIKLSEWKAAKLDFARMEESRQLARNDFRERVKAYVAELKKTLKPEGDVVFAHLMAGGVPRAKIIMPLMNRVFKGIGERYLPSQEFWSGDLGKFCAMSFEDVTAWTFQVLIEETAEIRMERESKGFKVGYTAYGYHGTEILIGDDYEWQTYSPYLQGWAKMQLEEVAIQAVKGGINACVYNCPEILTNSSSIFQGVEVPLYSLMKAYDKEKPGHAAIQKLKADCLALLKPGTQWSDIEILIEDFYSKAEVRKTFDFAAWPTHTTANQLQTLLENSQKIFDFHQDTKSIMTSLLSEKVFEACGHLMLHTALTKKSPVLWINHDVIAKMA